MQTLTRLLLFTCLVSSQKGAEPPTLALCRCCATSAQVCGHWQVWTRVQGWQRESAEPPGVQGTIVPRAADTFTGDEVSIKIYTSW